MAKRGKILIEGDDNANTLTGDDWQETILGLGGNDCSRVGAATPAWSTSATSSAMPRATPT